MAERELAILLTAKNLASRGIKTVTTDVGKLGKAAKISDKSMRTLGKGAAIAGTAIITGLGIAVKSGLDSLAEREDVISATEAAIRATGGAAHIAAPEIRSWAESIEDATNAAVDDKAIQAGMTALLRIPQIHKGIFKRVAADAVDLGVALKTDAVGGAKLLGKAIADPVKGMAKLTKAGIILTKSEQKRIVQLVKAKKPQLAQIELLKAVEKRYKGAAKASAGPYKTALNELADVSEDAKMALAEGFLPVIERVADVLKTELAKPQTIKDIRSLGQGIANGFSTALDAASKIPWDSIKDAMRLTGQGAKAAFDLFTGLPPWVQTAVVTGWGLNKLTGGAASDIVGSLASGLIKGVLGMTAGIVNINAGVVNGGGGGLPNVLPAAGGAAGTAAAIGTGLAVSTIVLSGAVTVVGTMPFLEKNNTLGSKGLTPAEITAQKYYNSDTAAQQQALKHLGSIPSRADFESGNAKLRAAQQKSTAEEREGMQTAARSTAAATRAANQQVAAAVRDKDLSVTLQTTLQSTTIVNSRKVGSSIATTTIRSHPATSTGSGTQGNGGA